MENEVPGRHRPAPPQAQFILLRSPRYKAQVQASKPAFLNPMAEVARGKGRRAGCPGRGRVRSPGGGCGRSRPCFPAGQRDRAWGRETNPNPAGGGGGSPALPSTGAQAEPGSTEGDPRHRWLPPEGRRPRERGGGSRGLPRAGAGRRQRNAAAAGAGCGGAALGRAPLGAAPA